MNRAARFISPLPEAMRGLVAGIYGPAGQAIGQLLFAVLSTRWLPPESRGRLVLLLTAGNLWAAVGSAGLVVEGRRLAAREGRVQPGAYMAASWIGAAIALATAATFGTLLMLAVDGIHGPESVGLLMFFSASQASMNSVCAALYGYRDYRGIGRTTSIGFLLPVAGIVALKVSGLGVSYAAAGLLAVNGSLVGSWLTRRRLKRWVESLHAGPSRDGWRLYRSALRSSPGPLTHILLQSADRQLLGMAASPASVASYAAAKSFSRLPEFVSLAGAQVILTESSHKEQRRAASQVRLVVLANVGIAAFGIVLADILVPLTFGSHYQNLGTVTRIALIGAVLASANQSYVALHQGNGAHRTVAHNSALGLAVMVLLVPLLGGLYGARGAATASSVTYGLMLLQSTRAKPRPYVELD